MSHEHHICIFSHELWRKYNNKCQVWLKCNPKFSQNKISISAMCHHYILNLFLFLQRRFSPGIFAFEIQTQHFTKCGSGFVRRWWGCGGGDGRTGGGVVNARTWGHQLTIFSPASPPTKRTQRTPLGLPQFKFLHTISLFLRRWILSCT